MIPSYRTLHTGRLLLTPVDAEQAPDTAALRAVLADCGLIGASLDDIADACTAGNALPELIGFTGCAVQLDTQGEHGGAFVHVRIEGPHPRPILKHGRNTRPPRCPRCHAALAAWREQLPPSSTEAEPTLRCPDCGTSHAARYWNWRRHAGIGRTFVTIEEVFPGEATPLPALLKRLEALKTGPWQYFYIQDQPTKPSPD